MSDAKPFQSGDRLTIIHDGGQSAEVVFCGMFGNRFDQAYVRWPMAGEYKVKLDTGRLTPSRVAQWRVSEPDLKRLAVTRVAEQVAARERTSARRTSGGLR